jgi:hypothetical protein
MFVVLTAVGLAGFEPATSCSQSRRPTKLGYNPSITAVLLVRDEGLDPSTSWV